MSVTLLLPAALTLGVLFVNGWTDAPNAIATAVATRALTYRRAVALAALCNLLGCLTAAALSGAVAATMVDLADFGSGGSALTALCAAMAAVILWATLAWRFGLPTSESHALLAGLSGSAAALQGDLSCLRPAPWCKTLLGLFLSLAVGFLLARALVRHLPQTDEAPYRPLQTAGAALMAFAHGAQDGQKFLGILLLAAALAPGGWRSVPLPLLTVLCAATMALGTACGGRRIVDTLGQRLVPLTPRAGFAADLAGGLCLLALTLLGAPVSTTHTKAAAILGAGSVHGTPDRAVAAELLLAWLLTFPACGALAWLLTRITM